MQKHKVWHIIFGAATVLGSWALWQASVEIMRGASLWWAVAVVASTLAFVSSGLFIATAKNLWHVFFLALLAFFPWAIFSLSILLSAAAFFATLLLTWSAASTREDIRSRIKVRTQDSFRYGFGNFVFALSLFVSALYFWHSYSLPATDLIPQLEIGERTSTIITRLVASVNPEFSALENKNMTVNQFFSEIYKNQANYYQDQDFSASGSEGSGEEKQAQSAMQQTFLDEKLKELSDVTGRTLTGSESMSQVLLDIINAKTRSFVVPKGVGSGSPSALLASVLALLVFFTIFSIGMIARFVWLPLLSAAFLLFRRTGCILVRNDMREVEVIQT